MAKSFLYLCAICACVAPAMGAMIDPFDIGMEYNIVPGTGESVMVIATDVEAGDSGFMLGTNQVWTMDSSVTGDGIESYVLTILRANNTQMLADYMVRIAVGKLIEIPTEADADVPTLPANDFIILPNSIEVEFTQSLSPSFGHSSGPALSPIVSNPSPAGWGLAVEVMPEDQDNITAGPTSYVTGVQIRFDVQAIPEPASLAVLACGSLLLVRRRK